MKEPGAWTSQAGPGTYWLGSLEGCVVAKSRGLGGLQAHSLSLLRSEYTPTIPTITLLQAGDACVDSQELLLTCTVLGNLW